MKKMKDILVGQRWFSTAVLVVVIYVIECAMFLL